MSAAQTFRRVFTRKNLRHIYFTRVQPSGTVGIDRVRPRQLEVRLDDELKIIAAKAIAGRYKFTPYKQKLVSKGQGAPPRVISIATARDRVALRGLCEVLAKSFPDAVPALPQLAIESLAKALASGSFGEFVKVDIKSFFPSIPHSVIRAALATRIRKKELLSVLDSAIQTPTVPGSKGKKGSVPNAIGVPQGLAISNILAEISLMALDASFKGRADILYMRYVDDILILTPPGEAEGLWDAVSASLLKLGLSPHALDAPGSKSRVGPLTESFTFLGYEVTGSQIAVRKESVLKFEASLASIFTSYRYRLRRARSASEKAAALAMCQWRLNLRITGCIFEGRRRGWVFYFSQISTTSQLRRVGQTIDSLVLRFGLNGSIHRKSLIKTYYEGRRRNKLSHNYIPNFDSMSAEQQRGILSLYLGSREVRNLSDKRVSELFKLRISAAVRELEADLSRVS